MPYQCSQRASSADFGSAQVCVRRELLYSRGLKGGLPLENVENRVLHSTHRATFYLTARVSTGSLPHCPSNKGSFHSLPRYAEILIHSETHVNTSSNGSIGTGEVVPDRMEGQRRMLVDGLSKARRIMDCTSVQQKPEDSSHVSTSVCKPFMWIRHQEAIPCQSSSLQNGDTFATSNLTSLQTFHTLMLHIPSGEFCEEDAEAPSTPDLRPEVRSWDCKASFIVGADRLPPSNASCPKDVNDVPPEDNPCCEAAGTLLLEEDNVGSTCISLCPRGTANNVYTLTDEGRDISKDHSSVSKTSCKSSSCFLYGYGRSANSEHDSEMSDSSTCGKQDMFQRLLYFSMVSALSICATSHNKESHIQLLHTLQSCHGLHCSLKWERLNCWGKILCEQFLEGIQISFQVCNPSLPMGAATAEGYSKQVVHKHVCGPFNQRNGHHEKTGAEIVAQEQRFRVIHVLSQRYLARRSRDHSWLLRCLCPDHDYAGNLQLNKCGSVLTSGRCLVSASKVPNLLEVAGRMLPRNKQQSSVMTKDLGQVIRESHVLTSSNEATGFISRPEEVSDANSVRIEKVEKCPNTCLSNIQAHPYTVCSGLMCHPKLVSPPVIRNQSEDLNINYQNDSIIGGKSHDYCLHAEGKRHESSCLQEMRVSVPHERGQERQSREKLERFAEVFMLRRHIKQQQQRAQRAPPYPTGNVVADGRCLPRTGVQSRAHTPKYTIWNMNSLGNGDHGPTMIPTSSLTKACGMTSTTCGQETSPRADVAIDIVELVNYLEGHSNRLEILADTAANSVDCMYGPITIAPSVLPNVGVVIVTIVAFVAYTKAFLEDALAWLESQAQSEEGN